MNSLKALAAGYLDAHKFENTSYTLGDLVNLLEEVRQDGEEAGYDDGHSVGTETADQDAKDAVEDALADVKVAVEALREAIADYSRGSIEMPDSHEHALREVLDDLEATVTS